VFGLFSILMPFFSASSIRVLIPTFNSRANLLNLIVSCVSDMLSFNAALTYAFLFLLFFNTLFGTVVE
jgi:hypothetical protein